MTMRDLNRDSGMRIALGALVLAVALTLWVSVRAFRPGEMPVAATTTTVSLDKMSSGPPRPAADIDAAVENDLFSSDRNAPATPYKMPGEDTADATPVPQPEKPAVLGTAVATDGRHFATVQLSNARPTLVRVGDTIGGWVVRSIERGKIALVSAAGTHVDVTVPKPGT